MVSSVYPSADGTPFVTGTFFAGIDHRTPIENRWGGWYVTGTHGRQKHLGNLAISGRSVPSDLDNSAGQNVTDLSDKIATSKFLSPHSDIVALMVFEHQTRMTNLMTRVGWQARIAQRGVTLCMEPLTPKETNFITTCGQAAELIDGVKIYSHKHRADACEHTSGLY